MPVKQLKELGFKVEPIKKPKDGFVARIRGKAPTFYLKQTRSGVLRAYRSRNDKFETTIAGLYNFQLEPDGSLIGSPPESVRKPVQLEHAPMQLARKSA